MYRPYKVSAVYHSLARAGARWTDEGGWRLPEAFTDPESEARQAATGAGLYDESHRGKLELLGAGAAVLLGRFGAVSASVGSSTLDLAGVDGPIRCLRLCPDRFLVLTAAPAREPARRALEAAADRPACVHLTDRTSAFASFTLLGPRARDVLARVSALDLRERSFTDAACAQTPLAGVHATILREDWSRIPAYHLLVGRDVGEHVWDALWQAGGVLGLVPIGLAGARRLREGREPCTSS